MPIHAFRTGLDNAALALKNFSEPRPGKRRGAKVGFPRFKNRHSRQAVTFVELADGVDHHHWINPDTRSHVLLVLPQRAGDGTWEWRHTRPKGQQAPGRIVAARSRGCTPTTPTRYARCGDCVRPVRRRCRG